MKIPALALLCLACAASVTAQDAPKNADAALRRKTFEKVWKTVNEKFYDPDFNGADWKAARARYAPQAEAARTDEEFYAVLGRMLSELKVSHMEVIPAAALAQSDSPPVTTGLGLSDVEGRVTVVRVLPGSAAERAGVRPGFVLVRVDGEEVKTLGEAADLLDGEPGTKARVTLLDAADAPREFELERSAPRPGEVERTTRGKYTAYARFEARRLEGGVGYVRFSAFIPALDRRIAEAVSSMHDAPGLVIDLRGNGGGEDSVAVKLAGLLFDKPTQLMVTRKRGGEDFYYKARPAKRPYLGPVAVLVDGRSGSASEQLTAGLQEAGRAYVVGNVTAGDDMDAELEELPNGDYLVYAAGLPHTPKGAVVEGRGVRPDLEVNLTRAGLLRGEDAQLEAALRYIRTQKTPKGNH